MDNLTHTLTGILLARTGLDRWCPRAAWILVAAANIPDADAITVFAGPLEYLRYHRGLSHSLVMAPILGILCAAVVRFCGRKPAPWVRASIVGLIGVLSHLLLDWTNVYGVRLLLPFSEAWLRLDINYIVDFWIWIALFAAVAAPMIGRLVSTEIGAKPGSGRVAALLGLAFLLLYDGARFMLHQRAMETLDARIYEGARASRVAAFPRPAKLFAWNGLVEAPGFMSLHEVNLGSEFDPTAGRVFYKPDASTAISAARATAVFREFLAFSQYPLWRVVPVAEPENAVRVEAMDLRFGTPETPRFIATAIVDAGGVVSAGFAFEGRLGY